MGKNRKGITLIALVVTIIVLLILAGVTITMLTGQNGVLDKAETAQRKTAESEAREKVELMLGEWVTEYTLSETPILDEYLKTSTYLEKREIYDVIDVVGPDDDKYVATVKVGNENYEVIINAEDTSKPFVEIVRVAGAKDPEPPIVPPTPPEDPPSSEEPVKLLEMINHTRISASDIINNTVVQELVNNITTQALLMSKDNWFDGLEQNSYVSLPTLGDGVPTVFKAYSDSSNNNSTQLGKYVWRRKELDDYDKYWLSKNTTSEEHITAYFENFSNGPEKAIPYRIKVQNLKYGSYYRCKTFYLEGAAGTRLTPNLILKDNDDEQIFDIECSKGYHYYTFYIIDKYVSGSYSSGVKNIWIYYRDYVDEEVSSKAEFGDYEVDDLLKDWIATLGMENLSPEDIISNKILRQLLNNKDSLEYMFSHNEIYNAVLNSSIAMDELRKSEIGKYLAVAIDENRTGLFTSPYIEDFAKNCTTIPTLSTNTNVIVSSENSSNIAWKTFDKNTSTYWWTPNTSSTEYIGYNFNKKVIPFRVKLVNLKSSTYRCKTFQIMGSNNSGTYNEASLTSKLILQENDDVQTFNVDNGNEYRYVTCYIYDKYTTSSKSTGLCEFEVYCVEKPDGL